MALRDINDAKHWRDRAAEMRALADGYSGKEAAQIMLRLADHYDKLADRAEDRARSEARRRQAQPGERTPRHNKIGDPK